MEAAEMRRAKAALLAARARDLRHAEPRQALQAATRALGIDPGLTPAAVAAAQLLAQAGRQRKAAHIIEGAWRLAPHPDLAEAYLTLQPNPTAAERLKQMTKLAALKPEHEESRVALAQSRLAAREFAGARSALAPLADGRPTARVCLLMAEIEEAENGTTGLAREWLGRAAHAPRDPAWMAGGAVAPHWEPVEPETGRIGAYVWEHPPELIPPPPIASQLPVKAIASGQALPAPRPAIEARPPMDTRPIEAQIEPEIPQPGAQTGAVPAGVGANGPLASVEGNAAPSPEPTLPAAPPAKIEAVAFPLDRAPDDPGPETPRGKGLWQRLTQ
jgi:HemY protein